MANNLVISSGNNAKDVTHPTPEWVRADGEVKVQTLAIKVIGLVVGVLAYGGMWAFFIYPENAKDLWTVIAPIILAAVTGTLGFLAGEKSANRKRQ